MTPGLRAVYDELVARAASGAWEAETRRLRGELGERCGRFERDHPAAASRDAASIEFALLAGGLAQAIATSLEDPGERGEAARIAAALPGILVFRDVDGLLVADDLWTGACWWIAPQDDVGRDVQLQLPDSPVAQCHLVVQETGCIILPGVTFHPADALAPIRATLARARELCLSSRQVAEALLKMEHSWQTLSRVKVGYAYRPDALRPA
ncbi:MAG: hypothetical protein KC766_26880 [Myxococcales bacterium]|nr:hypothetical protein [Myxococcales bacterium]